MVFLEMASPQTFVCTVIFVDEIVPKSSRKFFRVVQLWAMAFLL